MLSKNWSIFSILIIVILSCRKPQAIDPNETHVQLAERITSYVTSKDLSHLDEVLKISVAEISNYSIVREAEEAYLQLFAPEKVHARLDVLNLDHQNRIYFMLKDEKSLHKFIAYCNSLVAASPLDRSQCYENVKHVWPNSMAAWVKKSFSADFSGAPVKIEKYMIVLKNRGTPSGHLVLFADKALSIDKIRLSETNIREEFLYENGYISDSMAYECCMATENSLESCEGGGENALWEYGANGPDFKAYDRKNKKSSEFPCLDTKERLYRKVKNKH